MITDVFTKFSKDYEITDLCENVDVCEPVKQMYSKYKGRCEAFLQSVFSADKTQKNRYIYIWYAKTEPKRIFYVGKGTGSRYRHILHKIEAYKNGKKNERFKRFSQIQDRWGIDYCIVIKGLSDYEALIYEQCLKLELIDNGEVLLNLEGIPYEDVKGEISVTYKPKTEPIIVKDEYYERYFDDYSIPAFDKVTKDGLIRTHIYPYFVDETDNRIIADKELIIKWLENNKCKMYKTVSTKTKSVIVQGLLMYERYVDYRGKGISIYNAQEVLEFIKNN